MAEGGVRERCLFYNTRQGCRNGDRCRYLHVRDDVRPLCRFYSGPGTCWNGDNCYYRHSLATTLTPKNVKAQTSTQPLKDISNIESKKPNVSDSCEKKTETDKKKPNASVTEQKKVSPTKSCDSSHQPSHEPGSKSEGSGDGDTPRILKCGECGATFSDDTDGDPLLDHYMEMFLKFDYKHLAFLKKDPSLTSSTMCNLCDRFFCEVKDYLRHIKDKVKNGKEDAQKHRDILESVAIDFCSRDIGIMDAMEFADSVRNSLVSTYEGMDSDDEMDGLATMLGLVLGKHRVPPGFFPMGLYDDSDDDSDDDVNCWGFDEDDMFELACQGIKPWDPEAHTALAVLNGGFDY